MNNPDFNVTDLQKVVAYINVLPEVIASLTQEMHAWMQFTREQPELFKALQEYAQEESRRQFDQAFCEGLLECCGRLAERSWFLDPEIPLSVPIQILEWLDAGNGEKVDAQLAGYYTFRLSEIEREIIAVFPRRRDVLEAAFRAHRNKEFYLSIPVFLAQADGLSYEIYQSHFFRSRDSIPAAANFIQTNNAPGYVVAFAHPLTHRTTIRESTRNIATANTLNRHSILHGMDLAYGTEIGSLKCISLLSYLHGIITLLKLNIPGGSASATPSITT